MVFMASPSLSLSLFLECPRERARTHVGEDSHNNAWIDWCACSCLFLSHPVVRLPRTILVHGMQLVVVMIARPGVVAGARRRRGRKRRRRGGMLFGEWGEFNYF